MCYCSLFVTFHVASDIDWCCSTHRQGFLGEDITLWLCDPWSLFSFPLEDVPQFPLSSWYSTDVIIIIVPSFCFPLMIITPIGRGKEKGMPPFYPGNFCSISYSFHLNFPPSLLLSVSSPSLYHFTTLTSFILAIFSITASYSFYFPVFLGELSHFASTKPSYFVGMIALIGAKKNDCIL